MQFVDLHSQFDRIETGVKRRFDQIFAHKQFIMGPEVKELEQQLAAFTGMKHVVSCASGTDALVISLMSMGLTQQDAVFVPAFTFFASAESICLAGATPVFVDVDEDTFNIDTASLMEQIERVRKEGSLRPRGIIPVDLFGLPAEHVRICEIAKQYGLFVLEDGAQGFGGRLGDRRLCSFGDMAATSFFPAKPLGGYGDGGAIFTDSDERAALLRSIRVHGQGTDRYVNDRIGLTGRLDTLQAAVLLEKLPILEEELERRDWAAQQYTARLGGSIKTPSVPDGCRSAWAQYTLTASSSEHREAVLAALREAEIPSAIYYPIPLHLQRAFAFLGGKKGDLPVCEKLSERVFSLPMHPYLSEEDIDRIAKVVKSV